MIREMLFYCLKFVELIRFFFGDLMDTLFSGVIYIQLNETEEKKVYRIRWGKWARKYMHTWDIYHFPSMKRNDHRDEIIGV